MGAELAAIAPQRVMRLMLVNPLGLWLDATPGEDPFAVHPGMPTEILFTEPGLRKTYLFDGRDKVDAHVEELLSLRAGAKFLWPIPDTGIKKRMGRIKAPTLIVTSEHDRIVPAAYGPAWQQGIARAELAVLPGAGHVPELEQPEALAGLATRFLTSSARSAVA
jgi:pimeloyl-ACP methyl ester carboxylesterase